MSKLKWNREFALDQAADDEELLDELIEIFKDSCKADFQMFQEGLEQKDAAKVTAAAHSIKGAAASLGIEGIREVCLAIEEESRNGMLEVATLRSLELEELLLELQQL